MKHRNIGVFLPHLGCPHHCSFCDQSPISGVVKAPTPLEVEQYLTQAVQGLQSDGSETEIALFGGSFTALPDSLQEEYLTVVSRLVNEYGLKGIRLSTRPDAVDEVVLKRLLHYGVTAVELGAQSMDEEVLQKNGRGHTAKQVETASKLISQTSMELGLQMMTGLYGDTPERSRQTAKKLADLHPKTVRIYPTVVLQGTQLGNLYQQGLYQPPNVSESVTLCSELLGFFEDQGITVIKLGLHAQTEVEERLLAGCYHPAFRELCESERYYNQAVTLLAGQTGEITLWVARGETSKMVGQKRKNILQLQQQYPVRLKIREDNKLGKGQLKLAKSEQ